MNIVRQESHLTWYEVWGTVLAVFNDQVLFLKHNLNARAIASIQNEVTNMERDVASLIEDMNLAIAEAEAFLKQFKE